MERSPSVSKRPVIIVEDLKKVPQPPPNKPRAPGRIQRASGVVKPLSSPGFRVAAAKTMEA